MNYFEQLMSHFTYLSNTIAETTLFQTCAEEKKARNTGRKSQTRTGPQAPSDFFQLPAPAATRQNQCHAAREHRLKPKERPVDAHFPHQHLQSKTMSPIL
jgi:hypothetical protein